MAKHVRIRTGLAGLLLSASLVASATPQSPLIAPADPIGYFERLTRARALIAKEDFAGAEPLLEQLAREYPRDRLNWSLLGLSKRRLNKCAEAIPAYQRSIEIVGPYWSAARYWIAACQLKLGKRQDALDTLETHIFEDARWAGPRCSTIRNSPLSRVIRALSKSRAFPMPNLTGQRGFAATSII